MTFKPNIMKKAFPLIIGLFLLVTSCKKPFSTTPDVTHYTLAPELKAYFNWHKGSYWIFTDSLTSSIDSFAETGYDYLTSDVSNYHTNETGSIGFWEFYNLPADTFRVWELELSSSQARMNVSDLTNPYQLKAYYGFTEDFPFNLISTDPTVHKSIIPSIVINGKNYQNVYRYYVQYDASHADEILMNADSGFIKMSFSKYSQQVLLLQKAHIVH
jgi:hypothetical protein